MDIRGKKGNIEKRFLLHSPPCKQHWEKQGLVGEETVAGRQALGSLGSQRQLSNIHSSQTVYHVRHLGCKAEKNGSHPSRSSLSSGMI